MAMESVGGAMIHAHPTVAITMERRLGSKPPYHAMMVTAAVSGRKDCFVRKVAIALVAKSAAIVKAIAKPYRIHAAEWRRPGGVSPSSAPMSSIGEGCS